MAVLCAVPLLSVAGPKTGCDEACASNALAVFSGKSQYTMRIDDAARAHVAITWRARRNPKLKPVSFEGTAPVRLRNTKVHGVQFDSNDACKAVVQLLEFHDDDFEVYEVTLRNKQCPA